MQQRRFTLFMVLSIAIFAGWMYLQYKLWPPKPDYRKLAPAVNLVVDRAPLGAGPGVDLGRLAWNIEQLHPSGKRKSPAPEPERPVVQAPREVSAFAFLTTEPSLGNIGVFSVFSEFLPKAAKAVETYSIGDKDSFVQALLTTRGAGVQRLILNKFQAANWLGEPVPDQSLELIPADTEVASFLMYHYAAPESKDVARPLITLGQKTWNYEGSASKDGAQEVRFSTTFDEPGMEHIRVTKTYRLSAKDYHLGLSLEFKNLREDGPETIMRYQLAGPHGLPIEGEWYTSTYRNAVVGMVDNSDHLWRSLEDSHRISMRAGGDRVPEDARGESALQYAGVVTQYFASLIVVDNEQSKKGSGVNPRDILAWARPTRESTEKRVRLKALAGDDLLVVEEQDAQDKTAVKLVQYKALPRVMAHLHDAKIVKDTEIVLSYYTIEGTRQNVATWVRRATAPRPYFDDITVRVNSEVVKLRPNERVVHKFLLYNGPVKTTLLGQFSGEKEVAPELVLRYRDTLHLRSLTDYQSAGPLGNFSQAIRFTDLLIVVTRLMHWLLNLLHMIVGNYGLAIILLTLIVRGLMFPISRKQAYFSVKMQELAPEMKKIQEKYKNDARGRTEATMALYRQHKVHPLGSCLPLLMQLPIFLGLYYALQESVHFRLAPFLWIRNLAAPDMLVHWGESIPLISDADNTGSLLSIFYLGPYFNLLPIFAVGLMIVQQRLMTPPAMDEQQAMQQKMMKYMMIVFGVLFYKVASGLCIYFITSSLWGLAERRMLPKRKPNEPTTQAPVAQTKPTPPSTKGKGPKGKGGPKKGDKPDGRTQKVKDWWQDVLKKASKK